MIWEFYIMHPDYTHFTILHRSTPILVSLPKNNLKKKKIYILSPIYVTHILTGTTSSAQWPAP